MVESAPAVPGLRERKRARTAQALVAAALELFDQDGYDETSVAAIADRAGVHERTFFRYFASKEDVAFLALDPALEWLAEALASRPKTEPPWTSLAEAFVTVAERQEPADLALLRRQQRVLHATPVLAGREALRQRAWAHEITALLATHAGRPVDDRQIVLFVTAMLAVVQSSTDAWIQTSRGDLASWLRHDLALVAAMVPPHDRPSRSRQPR